MSRTLVTSAGPHQARVVGGQTYRYDANGNLLSGGVTESYTYDADGERLTRTAGGVTTVYVGGLYEEDLQTGVTRTLYQFNGQIIAQRSSDASGLIFLHADHLGSVSLATSSSGAVVSRQDVDPWGSLRSGGISQTSLNDTGQRRDSTGLLYYHARYYDSVLGRFVSADSVVPGAPDGSMDGVALKPLTVDFHEPGFVSGLNAENTQGFWFQNSDQVAPWGPEQPQALNRYAYVQNNPLRYTDPDGHYPKNYGTYSPKAAGQLARTLRTRGNQVGMGGSVGGAGLNWLAKKVVGLIPGVGWIVTAAGVETRRELHAVAELLNLASIDAAKIEKGRVYVSAGKGKVIIYVSDGVRNKYGSIEMKAYYEYTFYDPIAQAIFLGSMDEVR